jgi:3'-phosphoadenosine 5'-phosphosulfate sulfotransferase (PAPS reductase)/FAD synthetase
VTGLAAVNGRSRRPLSFVLFSGGHDSLCATHVAMSRGLATEVVHVNTGIGVEQTRRFVRDTCAEHGWPLNEVEPPVSYADIVTAEGFPGPAAHFYMYVRLKERALAAFARSRKFKRGQQLVYVTGVRRDESKRRTAHVSERQDAPKQGWSWYAPIWDWTKAGCNTYIDEHGLERNEVVDLLHMSGECLCGSFAKPGERAEIRRWFPDTDEQIAALEQRVREAGHHGCVWGQRPPNVHRDQLAFAGMLCTDCEAA